MSEEPVRAEGSSPARVGEEEMIRMVLEEIRGRLPSRSCAGARGFIPRSTTGD